MIGDNAKGLIASARKILFPTRMFVNVKAELLKPGETPDTNPDIISTYGQYHIVYNVCTRNGEPAKKKFALVTDFGQGYIKFANWVDFHNQQYTNEFVKFILKYTNMSKQLVNIAVQNEGMHIPIQFDVIKYDADVRAKAGIEDKTRRIRSFNPFVGENGIRDKKLAEDKIKETQGK